MRGLGGRYSSVLRNGAQVPTPDPTMRAVPQDLFPTQDLSGIQVQKTWSADLPGEFAGGSVLLRSKGADSDDFHLRLAVSGKYLHGTTGRDGLVHAGGGRDWLADGVDARAFPPGISPLPADPMLRQQVGQAVAAGLSHLAALDRSGYRPGCRHRRCLPVRRLAAVVCRLAAPCARLGHAPGRPGRLCPGINGLQPAHGIHPPAHRTDIDLSGLARSASAMATTTNWA